MATTVDAINRLKTFSKQLEREMPSISKDVGALFLRLKIQEIKQKGIGNYSPTLYAASWLKGKELNGLGKTFIRNKIKNKERTNWAELRKAQGLQIKFVDVYYSGQMLNSTGIISSKTASFTYYVIIGGRNDEAKKKLYANQQRYGNFLKPNPEQEKAMADRALFLIGRLYKRILNI